jgi:hypothetical protein
VVEHFRFNFSTGTSRSDGARQVIEPELDMKRSGAAEPSAVTSRIVEIVRRFAPNLKPGGSPMRSVAREIEELWPSRDR